MKLASALLFLGMLIVSSVLAAEKPALPRQEGPIDITSDRLEADDAAKTVRFLGQVVARQGDVTLTAQEMVIFLPPQGEEIDRIEAFGDVRIVQGERVATGQKALYLNRQGEIHLTGSPKVHQGRDLIAGEEIIVYLNEERSVVKGGAESRVKAIFHPQEKQP
ncbi:MAG: lipopolysaccharide transport periplasmic protein LptA [Desulfuromonadales bacterium]|nr:lipopolysaccharide transport periplasmic protein LptA [Desulfuromonadales bacterium]